MLNIAICDDEKYICDFLKKSVTDCLAKADIEGNISVFDDGQPLCDLYKEDKASFDLILLDIKPDGGRNRRGFVCIYNSADNRVE